jgi:ribosome maturation factor RimP
MARFFLRLTLNSLITKTLLESRILLIAKPIVQDMGFEVIRIRLIDGKSKLIQIMIDSPKMNLTVDDCANVSNELSAAIDVEDPYEDAFNLEVSSPGIDRPLTRLCDFDQWSGYEAKLETTSAIEGQKRFKGILSGTDDDEVLIKMDIGTIGLKFDWLSDAKLILTDELLRETLQNQKNIIFNEDDFDYIEKEEG